MNCSKIFTFLFPFLLCTFISANSFSQLVVTTSQPATVLASALAGAGVTVLSPTLTCAGVANGKFTAAGTPLAMSNGIVLTNGHSAACAGPEGALVSFTNGTAGDPAMAPFLPAGTSTYDACILEFDMVATGDSIGFNYQFGSEEYRNAVCSQYTDVFAFFISGPGIVGTPNMALVPGTTIPVEINSVNNGGLGTVGGAAHVNCTSLGAGSPFTAYYIDNTGGSLMSYRGYTTKFRAAHAVTACDTYHLKLSIVDAGDAQYDSGVFIEGGSLTTNSYSFNYADSIGATINGVPHTIVKGCSPATVYVTAAHSSSTATTLGLSFGGTAVNGVDVSTIPGTVTIPSGSTSVGINVQGIPTPPGGSKTLTIYLHGTCSILDSVSINIMDTPSAHILTPDTAVCLGQSFQIDAIGTAGLIYNWAPPAGLSSNTVMQPTCTPAANTIYTMTATLPGSGCPAIVRTIAVGISSATVNILTPDTTICYGAYIDLFASGSAGSVYSWSPATGLSNPNIQNPVATPSVTTTYTVTTTTTGGCIATAAVTITVTHTSITMFTPDTTICYGASVNLLIGGSSSTTYSWSPSTGLNNPNIQDPTATPSVTTTYVVNSGASGGGCIATASVTITVANPAVVILTPDTTVCAGVPVDIRVNGSSTLIYTWTPALGLNNPNIMQPIATPSVTTVYILTGTYPGTPCAATAQFTVTIAPPLAVTATSAVGACNSAINFTATPAGLNYRYVWTGPHGFIDSVPNPYITNAIPADQGVYHLTVFENATGCSGQDSTTVIINPVFAMQLTNVTQNETIPYGSSVQLNADNAVYYWWMPNDGSLNNRNINNPVATPTENTTYTVYGMDSSGCMDSANVIIDVTFDSITIPSAFTPNGDGLNDIFRPIGMKYQKMVSFSVYNRWGQLVFTTSNKGQGWDGTFNGMAEDMGVYNYLLIVALDDGSNRVFKGNVTLIR